MLSSNTIYIHLGYNDNQFHLTTTNHSTNDDTLWRRRCCCWPSLRPAAHTCAACVRKNSQADQHCVTMRVYTPVIPATYASDVLAATRGSAASAISPSTNVSTRTSSRTNARTAARSMDTNTRTRGMSAASSASNHRRHPPSSYKATPSPN